VFGKLNTWLFNVRLDSRQQAAGHALSSSSSNLLFPFFQTANHPIVQAGIDPFGNKKP